MQEVLKMSRKIKMASVYGECLKLKNKYYDTDSLYPSMYGGFTVKIADKNKIRIAEKAFLNRLYGKKVSK